MKTNEWLSKEEAGVRLGKLSNRRVLELAAEGRLESERVRDPNTGQMVVRIHSGSIERLLDERNAPKPIPDPSPRKPGEVREPPHPSQSLARRVTEVMAIAQMLREGYANGAASARSARLWLTVDEAADYSGLPAVTLRGLIGRGNLPAMDVGIRRGGRWRVRRIDLERIES
jgi:excisionase family DNA binding protein